MCRTAADVLSASPVDILGGSLPDACGSSVDCSTPHAFSRPTGAKHAMPTGSVSFPMGRACTSPLPSFRKSGSVAGVREDDSMGASQSVPIVRRVRVKTAGGKATILVRARTGQIVRSMDGSMTLEQSRSSEFAESHIPPNSRVVLFREISQEELVASGRFKKRSASDLFKEHEKSTDCSEAGSDESTEGGVHTELCRVDSGSTDASEEKKSIVRSALLDFVTSRPSLDSFFPRFNLFNLFKQQPKEEPAALTEGSTEEQQLALSSAVAAALEESEATLALSSGSTTEAVFFEYAIVPDDDDDDDEEGALVLENGCHNEVEALARVSKAQTNEQQGWWETCQQTFSNLFVPSFLKSNSNSEPIPVPKAASEPIFIILSEPEEEQSSGNTPLALRDSEPPALDAEEDEEQPVETVVKETTKPRADSPWVLASGAVVLSLGLTAATIAVVRSRSAKSWP